MNKTILNDILENAKIIAQKNKHENIYLIHVLASLVNTSIIQSILNKCQCNFELLVLGINDQFKSLDTVPTTNLTPLSYSQEVLMLKEISIKKAEHGNQQAVELFNVLSAILEFNDSESSYLLKTYGFNPSVFNKEIIKNKQNYSQFMSPKQQTPEMPENKSHTSQKNKNNPESAIEELSWITNLNESVKKISVDPMIGREKEVSDLIHTLAKKKKSNAILVGEPGVGKTSIVEGFAQKINEGKVPDSIKKYKIYSLDVNGLMSQTAYRGQLEAKIKETLDILKKIPNAVLFMDEVHMIIGANAGGDGAMSVGNILKPVMSSGELKFIGATTYKEFVNLFEKDAALNRRFQKIDVEEPSQEDCLKILEGLKTSYEKFHDVKIMSESLETAVKLSVKFMKGKFLPDKAIDLMDEASTLVKFAKEKYNGIVSPEAIRKVVSKIARVPEETMTESVKKQVETLAVGLNKVIFGQEDAISKIEETILLAKSGLSNENKPLGSFMFAGPTGVGKTELTNQLSKLMSIPMARIDMSEFKESHTVSKLIGAPPGYVNSDQEGQLTSIVMRNPSSIILLDEIEKAHPEVMDLLLQVLDHGTLTDSKGKKADFRQSIIICTTNTGTEELTKSVIGMTTESIQSQRNPLDAVRNSFRPEFINRFDNLIWFNSLSKENIKSVLNKLKSQLDTSLVSKNVKITLTPEAEDFIINKGYSPKYGARPMERVFSQEIKVPLSREIIYGKLQNGGQVSVSVEDNKLTFSFKTVKAKKVKEKNAISI